MNKSKLFTLALIALPILTFAADDHRVEAEGASSGMDYMSIGIGLVVGLIIGYFVGRSMKK